MTIIRRLRIETDTKRLDLQGDLKFLLNFKRCMREPAALLEVGDDTETERIRASEITKLEYQYFDERMNL